MTTRLASLILAFLAAIALWVGLFVILEKTLFSANSRGNIHSIAQ